MDHVAIMKKSWGLTRKILTGEKTIESRWYMARYPPWDRIAPGDSVYFKDSGEPVSIKAEVEKVLQFSSLNPIKVKNILQKYGKDDSIRKEDIPRFLSLLRERKYCMLIFLKNPRRVEPFRIDKKGFGTMAAWICVKDINKIKAD